MLLIEYLICVWLYSKYSELIDMPAALHTSLKLISQSVKKICQNCCIQKINYDFLKAIHSPENYKI